MNGGEIIRKGSDIILNRINSDCEESIAAVNAEADSRCEEILAQAKTQAEQNAAAIREKCNKQLDRLKEMSRSRAGLEARNTLLKTRREEIDKTVDALREHLLSLDDGAYFDALCRLAAKLGGKSGVLYLNRRDLDRLPADFESRVRDKGLDASVSREPVDISGGFILKNGDIEENMDFEAIIAAKRDEIEDLINRELFSE